MRIAINPLFVLHICSITYPRLECGGTSAASLCDGFDRALSDSAKPHCATCTPQVYGGYVSGIMGDEDNPQEERLDSVIEILSGATEEVSCAGDTHGGALFTRCEQAHRDADPPSSCCAGYVSDLARAHGMLAMYIRKFFNLVSRYYLQLCRRGEHLPNPETRLWLL